MNLFRQFIEWFKRDELKRIAELESQLFNAYLRCSELEKTTEETQRRVDDEQLERARENERFSRKEGELLDKIDGLYTELANKELEIMTIQQDTEARVLDAEVRVLDAENEVNNTRTNVENFKALMDKMGRNTTERVAQLRKQMFAKDKLHEKEIENLGREMEDLKDTYEAHIDNLKDVYELQIQDLFSQLERREELADVGMIQDMAELFFELEDSEAYKQAISDCIKYQEDLVVKGEACKCFTQWTVEGSRAKGERQTKDNIKLALKLFNLETNETIYKINSRSNLEAVYVKIERSFNAINRMNKVQDIHLQEIYLESKKRLAKLVYEQTMKVKQEKEIEAQRKAQLKEQELLEKEINKEKEKLMKEQQQYLKEIARLAKQKNQTDELLARIAELEAKVAEMEEECEGLDQYANIRTKAGWVYVISQPDSKDVKIGVTRRLDPHERIRELGSASVPFKFNTHATVFSEDAFSLEGQLHKHFDSQRVNKANLHKEFFTVSVEEVAQYIHDNVDSSVEFNFNPYNEEYEETLRLNKLDK